MNQSIDLSVILAVRIDRFPKSSLAHGLPVVKIDRRNGLSTAPPAKKPAPGTIGAGFGMFEFAFSRTLVSRLPTHYTGAGAVGHAKKGPQVMARKASSERTEAVETASPVTAEKPIKVERVSLSNQPITLPFDGPEIPFVGRLVEAGEALQVAARKVEAQVASKTDPISLPPEPVETTPDPTPDPAPSSKPSSFFSPERTRLSMGYSVFGGEAAGVKGEALVIKVQRPEKDRFFRACPDEGYSVCLPAITYRPEKDSMREELYITTMELVETVFLYDQAVSSCLTFLQITLCQELNGPFFLWPLKLGKEGRARWSDVTKNQVKALELAMSRFIRLTWNGRLHEVIEHRVNPAPQSWPSKSMEELLEMGFDSSNIVTDETHEVVKKLRGEL